MKIRVPANLNLFKGQPEGVKHLMEGKNRLLLDDMGFGKTCQSIVAANSLGLKKVLVLCPPGVRFQWGREIKKWSVIPYKVDVAVSTMHKFNIKERSAVVCPYNLLLSPCVYDQLKAVKWGALIADEIHFCKNTKAQRTAAVLGRTGLWRSSVYKWGLSGTIMTTTPIDLWPIAKTIGREHFRGMTWMQYTRQYCGRFRSKWGWDVKGATRLPELRSRLFDSGFAMRRERKALPGNQLRLVYVDEDPMDWSAITSRVKLNQRSLGLPAGEVSTLRSEIGMAKVEQVSEYLAAMAMGGEKIVVFTWHKPVTKALAERLRENFWQVVTYYGGDTPAQKERSLDAFKFGDADLLVANISSAGTGLDGLQRVCSYCVFAEPPWNFTDIVQAYKRLDREGQTLPVIGDILVSGNSVEDYIISGIARKEKIFNTVLGQQCCPS